MMGWIVLPAGVSSKHLARRYPLWLVLFLLMSIQSYLATYTLGEFRMSFWSFGPTELRVLLAAGNLMLFRWPQVWQKRITWPGEGAGCSSSGSPKRRSARRYRW